jgi:hypothetical protein
VVVTTNMFGDIVTDLAAVLQGGMGMAVGCNVGDDHGMFEPIHGSAPTLKKEQANPMAMVMATGRGPASGSVAVRPTRPSRRRVETWRPQFGRLWLRVNTLRSIWSARRRRPAPTR